MRGVTEGTRQLFSYVDIEDRIPADHPLRAIRLLVEEVLAGLSGEFSKLYSHRGRPSIPPAQLLKASLLLAFFTVRLKHDPQKWNRFCGSCFSYDNCGRKCEMRSAGQIAILQAA
ncbi:MAG: transposase [Aestuariivirga sp.]|nr:transposase [Aestuariivirga sp.]